MGAGCSSHVSVREGEIEIEKNEKNQQMCGQKMGLIGYDNAGSDAQVERERERCSEGKRKRERDVVKEKERGREMQ